jgi:hypothetical protein
MVAGHVDTRQPGADGLQRRRLLAALVDRAVGDVPGVADDVGFERVDRVGPFGPTSAPG